MAKQKKKNVRPKTSNQNTNRTTQIVKRELAKEFSRIDIGRAGMDFIECAINPFGVDRHGGPKAVVANVPDGSTNVVAVTYTCRLAHNDSTSTMGAIELRPPNATDNCMIKLHYGNNPLEPTTSPTATTNCVPHENVLLAAFKLAAGNGNAALAQCRKVSCALKVQGENGDNTEGMLWAYTTDKTTQTGAAAWNTYAYTTSNVLLAESRPASKGMQLRTSHAPEDTWAYVAADMYTNLINFGQRPVIVFSGLVGTLDIEAVIHVEYKICSLLVPFPLDDPIVEPELAQIVQMCDRFDHVVDGNSFKSFLKSTFSLIRKGLRYIADNPMKIATAAGALLSM